MVTVKIKENSKQAKHLLDYIKGLPFVEIVTENGKQKNNTLLADIEKGLREVKQIREGKLKPLSIDDLWDDK